jgi:hypothetical protein
MGKTQIAFEADCEVDCDVTGNDVTGYDLTEVTGNDVTRNEREIISRAFF